MARAFNYKGIIKALNKLELLFNSQKQQLKEFAHAKSENAREQLSMSTSQNQYAQQNQELPNEPEKTNLPGPH